LKDIEKLHSKVTNIINIDKDNILKNMHSQIINEAVDKLETPEWIRNFLEKQKQLTKNGIEL